jgi:hypothetical protein
MSQIIYITDEFSGRRCASKSPHGCPPVQCESSGHAPVCDHGHFDCPETKFNESVTVAAPDIIALAVSGFGKGGLVCYLQVFDFLESEMWRSRFKSAQPTCRHRSGATRRTVSVCAAVFAYSDVSKGRTLQSAAVLPLSQGFTAHFRADRPCAFVSVLEKLP